MVKVNIVECIYFKFCSTFKRKKIFKTKSEYRHIKQSNFDFNIALVLAKIRCVVYKLFPETYIIQNQNQFSFKSG